MDPSITTSLNSATDMMFNSKYDLRISNFNDCPALPLLIATIMTWLAMFSSFFDMSLPIYVHGASSTREMYMFTQKSIIRNQRTISFLDVTVVRTLQVPFCLRIASSTNKMQGTNKTFKDNLVSWRTKHSLLYIAYIENSLIPRANTHREPGS